MSKAFNFSLLYPDAHILKKEDVMNFDFYCLLVHFNFIKSINALNLDMQTTIKSIASDIGIFMSFNFSQINNLTTLLIDEHECDQN